MAKAHSQFSIEKRDVKNTFLQGTFDDKTHGELAAEPVPELRCMKMKSLCSRKRVTD